MDEELNPSCLGSNDFWNKIYNDEMKNFKDFGDVGEIWFGKQTAQRIINWIKSNSEIQKSDAILDLGVCKKNHYLSLFTGCGNGMLLIDLYSKGFNNLHGVDYSKNAIDLACAISEKKQCCINFFVGDILYNNFESTYSVVLDKGTYDSVSLNFEGARSKRQIYIKNMYKILKKNGYFIITSCNWTEIELLNHFCEFEHVSSLPAPKFQFGGNTGNTVTTVVFKKT